MKLAAAITAAATLCGCSLAFMEHLPDDYEVAAAVTPPRCATSQELPVTDYLDGTIDAILGGALVINGNSNGRVLGVAFLLSSAIEIVSGAKGSHWASECERAIASYDEQQRALTEADADRTTTAAVQEAERSRGADAGATGFVCTASSAGEVGACTRAADACAAAQSAFTTAGYAMTGCRAAASAWCFGAGDDHCAPSETTCQANAIRADRADECEERR